MQIFAKFGEMRNKDISSVEVQAQVQQLQNYITEHFYNCTKEILAFLGKMYVQSSEFKANIDNVGSEGTALFVSNAVSEYCKA
ncbi:MAG: TipAS antibiotic-recognition domain-containing protein [Oscillospiraceae bacterium]